MIANVDLALFDVAIGSRENVRCGECQGRGWQAHNHGPVAGANLGDAGIGDEILLLPADGDDLTILRPELRGAERQATNEQ